MLGLGDEVCLLEEIRWRERRDGEAVRRFTEPRDGRARQMTFHCFHPANGNLFPKEREKLKKRKDDIGPACPPNSTPDWLEFSIHFDARLIKSGRLARPPTAKEKKNGGFKKD